MDAPGAGDGAPVPRSSAQRVFLSFQDQARGRRRAGVGPAHDRSDRGRRPGSRRAPRGRDRSPRPVHGRRARRCSPRAPGSPRGARATFGLGPDAPVVCFVGRLTQVKRPERFIDLAIEVARSHPTTTFLVAGEGELLETLRERARALGDSVQFLGWRGDVATVYAASDVVVLTSDNEGMPVALIEAASIGTPAVTTRVGSAPEVVLDGVTGFVTGMEVASLVRATLELLENHDLRRGMGAAAADRARREFSAARLVADTAALYERIAAQRGVG